MSVTPPPLEVAYTIAPLEWTLFNLGKEAFTITPFGSYYVSENSGAGALWTWSDGQRSEVLFKSMGAAMHSAEADFRRNLECVLREVGK